MLVNCSYVRGSVCLSPCWHRKCSIQGVGRLRCDGKVFRGISSLIDHVFGRSICIFNMSRVDNNPLLQGETTCGTLLYELQVHLFFYSHLFRTSP